jgi:fluoroacetyl-CoA thioesterase
MKSLFMPGDNKTYKKIVSESDIAAFHGIPVHKVCSTFALARDMEWSSRLFVLDMKEEHEEGIGTFVSVNHAGPAFPGEEIIFSATLKSIHGNEIICSVEVTAAGRKVAAGETGQKILPKEKLEKYLKTKG